MQISGNLLQMCDVYEEAGFCQTKCFLNGLNTGLLLRDWVKKTWEETLSFSGKEKPLGATVGKIGYANKDPSRLIS